MVRGFVEDRLVIASHNISKVREIADLLTSFGLTVVSASDLNLPEPEEDGKTFLDNAKIKARSAAENSKQPALADDSGLVIEALGGRPGIHSARWAGPNKNFNLAMEKIEAALVGQNNRRACFVCALALCWPGGHLESFEGTVHGNLVWPPRGKRGFGYDPIFVPKNHNITFAEMNPAKKHSISHRADAFNKMIAACFIK